MRKILWCFAVMLLAFGIGYLTVPKFYPTTESKIIPKRVAETSENKFETSKPKGFGVGNGDAIRLREPIETPKLYKPTCSDNELLPLWNALKKDKEFKESEETISEEADCTNRLEIQKVDLNGDGRKEFIVWGRYNFCGGTGNCLLWIYEKKKGKFNQLLQSSAYYGESKWFNILKAKTNGFTNLLLKGHFTGYETTHSYFKFDGNKYVESKCLFEIYSMNKEKPAFMTCEEYSKKTEDEFLDSQSQSKE
ncbi:hypothetical protein BH20ACI4_BH20ACI4_03370 [soil metagenome]